MSRFKKIKYMISAILILIGIAIQVCLKVVNVDVSEMRLLVDYTLYYIVVTIVYLLAMLILRIESIEFTKK